VHPGDVTLPAGVDGVSVRDIQPSSITLHFESMLSRVVPVHSAIAVIADSGLGPITVKFEPESVRVSGPRQTVLKIGFVRTVKTTIALPDSLAHLVDVDTTQLGARVSPGQVRVQLTATPRPAGATKP
jgi:hypothetical protein